MKEAKYLMKRLRAAPGHKISLKDHDPAWAPKGIDKRRATTKLQDGVRQLAKYQDRLYAQDTYALLIIFQAMDAAGKDGTIRHVMSGLNPQGCQVFSFKAPSTEERDHDFLWRSVKALPERGRIGIHNRSHYEEVLVARVHPEILEAERLPAETRHGIWRQRFEAINNFEHNLVANGTIVLKFFLHVSKEEQKRRFLERIERPEKNWKFSVGDAKERGFWKDYMRAYEEAFTHTSTKHAPWYIIPADNKWFMRLAVAAITHQTLADLNLHYPTVSQEKKGELQQARDLLLAEKD